MFGLSRRTQLAGLAGGCLAVALLAVVLLAFGGSASSYYVALGDSLSVGIQPTADGQQVETDQGYVNDLYAHYRAESPQLKLREFGCPGDDTANVITGQGNALAARYYHCDRQHGSQLNAAVAFIRAHAGQVKLISIDIGANDINNCLNPTVYAHGVSYTIACVNRGEASIAANLPKILRALAAAAAPGTQLVAGQVYDPFLAGLLNTDAMERAISTQSIGLITKINSEIAYADAGAGFKTADVADAFSTYDTRRVTDPGVRVRVGRNLVVLCRYTWVCTRAPQGPNIHPNATGYRVIARAFEQVLPRSL